MHLPFEHNNTANLLEAKSEKIIAPLFHHKIELLRNMAITYHTNSQARISKQKNKNFFANLMATYVREFAWKNHISMGENSAIV